MNQNRDLVLSRSRCSPRVQNILATGIRVTALRILNHDISVDSARRWAREFTVVEAFRELVQRRKVQRIGLMNDKEQAQLINFLITQKVIDPSISESENLRKIMGHQSRNQNEKARLLKENKRIKTFVGRLQTEAPKQREFFRKANRLLTQQSNRISIEIYEREAQKKALASLNDLYESYFKKAYIYSG